MAQVYETSVDFTNDFYSAINKLQEAAKIFAKPEFKEWLKITDTNYLTETVQAGAILDKMVRDVLAHADVLDEELNKAN